MLCGNEKEMEATDIQRTISFLIEQQIGFFSIKEIIIFKLWFLESELSGRITSQVFFLSFLIAAFDLSNEHLRYFYIVVTKRQNNS